MSDAVSEWWNPGSKATIVYQPNDPFVLNFMHSTSIVPINEAIQKACQSGQSAGSVSVGTYEAFVNTALDALSSGYYPVAEAQLGAFDASFVFSSGGPAFHSFRASSTAPLRTTSRACITGRITFPRP